MAPRRLVALLVLAALLLFPLFIGPAFAQDSTQEPDSTQEATPEATEPPVEQTPESTEVSEPTFVTYVVQPGDTLAIIARRFNVPATTIMADNNITNPNLIFAGQTLRIRTSGPAPATPTPAPPTVTPISGPTTTIVVQPGDTLFRIAQRYNTTVAQLLALNNLANANLIFSGQTLIVPGEDFEPTATPPPPALTPEPAPDVEATAVPVADAEFGYGIEVFASPDNVAEVVNAVSQLGLGWVKYNVDWRDFEPVEGEINFAALDEIVAAFDAAGLNILLTVASAPDWARTTTEESGPPDDFADYAAFMGALAERYAGVVDAYEIWSEPNLRREWNSAVHPIGPESYLELLTAAYEAVKSADADATVVAAGLAPTGFNDGINAVNDRLFLAALYNAGLAGVSDALGAHPAGFANPPDAVCCDAAVGVETHFEDPSFYFLETLDAYRDIMVASGDAETPIWVTDFGWGTSEDTNPPSPIYIYVSYTSLAEQAIYTPRAFEIGETLGYVGPMFLRNLNGCLVEPALPELCFYSVIGPEGEPRPVFDAIQAIDKTTEAPEATEGEDVEAVPEVQSTPEANG